MSSDLQTDTEDSAIELKEAIVKLLDRYNLRLMHSGLFRNKDTYEVVGKFTRITANGGDCRPYNEIRVSWHFLGDRTGESWLEFQGNICQEYFSEQLAEFLEKLENSLNGIGN